MVFKAAQLKTVAMDKNKTTLKSVKMLKGEREFFGDFNFRIRSILEKYTGNFHELRKMKTYQIKLYKNDTVKPIDAPPSPITYYCKAVVDDVIKSINKQSVIEEHPLNEPDPWVSYAVTVPKLDSFLQITLDVYNITKLLLSNNYPIPCQKDIKTQLSGAN